MYCLDQIAALLTTTQPYTKTIPGHLFYRGVQVMQIYDEIGQLEVIKAFMLGITCAFLSASLYIWILTVCSVNAAAQIPILVDMASRNCRWVCFYS